MLQLAFALLLLPVSVVFLLVVLPSRLVVFSRLQLSSVHVLLPVAVSRKLGKIVARDAAAAAAVLLFGALAVHFVLAVVVAGLVLPVPKAVGAASCSDLLVRLTLVPGRFGVLWALQMVLEASVAVAFWNPGLLLVRHQPHQSLGDHALRLAVAAAVADAARQLCSAQLAATLSPNAAIPASAFSPLSGGVSHTFRFLSAISSHVQ